MGCGASTAVAEDAPPEKENQEDGYHCEEVFFDEVSRRGKFGDVLIWASSNFRRDGTWTNICKAAFTIYPLLAPHGSTVACHMQAAGGPASVFMLDKSPVHVAMIVEDPPTDVLELYQVLSVPFPPRRTTDGTKVP